MEYLTFIKWIIKWTRNDFYAYCIVLYLNNSCLYLNNSSRHDGIPVLVPRLSFLHILWFINSHKSVSIPSNSLSLTICLHVTSVLDYHLCQTSKKGNSFVPFFLPLIFINIPFKILISPIFLYPELFHSIEVTQSCLYLYPLNNRLHRSILSLYSDNTSNQENKQTN